LVASVFLLFLLLWGLFVNNNLQFIYDLLFTPLLIALLIEYVIKMFLAKDKIAYIKNDPFGIFIVIFPFLRPLKVIATSRFVVAAVSEQLYLHFPWFKKYRILEIFLFLILLVIITSDLLLVFEKGPHATIKTLGDAIWFTVSTIGTVGYGDVYPKTVAGRTLAILLIIFGVAIFGTVTAEIAAFFVDKDIKKEQKVEDEKLEDLLREEKNLEALVKESLSKKKE